MQPHFDTLETAENLRSLGFSQKQAKGIVEAINVAVTNTVATKQDLELLSSQIENQSIELNSKIGSVRSELKTDIKALELKILQSEQRILKWMMTLFAASVAVQSLISKFIL